MSPKCKSPSLCSNSSGNTHSQHYGNSDLDIHLFGKTDGKTVTSPECLQKAILGHREERSCHQAHLLLNDSEMENDWKDPRTYRRSHEYQKGHFLNEVTNEIRGSYGTRGGMIRRGLTRRSTEYEQRRVGNYADTIADNTDECFMGKTEQWRNNNNDWNRTGERERIRTRFPGRDGYKCRREQFDHQSNEAFGNECADRLRQFDRRTGGYWTGRHRGTRGLDQRSLSPPDNSEDERKRSRSRERARRRRQIQTIHRFNRVTTGDSLVFWDGFQWVKKAGGDDGIVFDQTMNATRKARRLHIGNLPTGSEGSEEELKQVLENVLRLRLGLPMLALNTKGNNSSIRGDDDKDDDFDMQDDQDDNEQDNKGGQLKTMSAESREYLSRGDLLRSRCRALQGKRGAASISKTCPGSQSEGVDPFPASSINSNASVANAKSARILHIWIAKEKNSSYGFAEVASVQDAHALLSVETVRWRGRGIRISRPTDWKKEAQEAQIQAMVSCGNLALVESVAAASVQASLTNNNAGLEALLKSIPEEHRERITSCLNKSGDAVRGASCLPVEMLQEKIKAELLCGALSHVVRVACPVLSVSSDLEYDEILDDILQQVNKTRRVLRAMVVKPHLEDALPASQVGDVYVEFPTVKQADECILCFSGRVYDGRPLFLQRFNEVVWVHSMRAHAKCYIKDMIEPYLPHHYVKA